jgi:hypothetical protein
MRPDDLDDAFTHFLFDGMKFTDIPGLAADPLPLDEKRARAEQHLRMAQAHMRGDWIHDGEAARIIERELLAVIDLNIEHSSCYFCVSGERTDAGEYVHSLDCPVYLACMGQLSASPPE